MKRFTALMLGTALAAALSFAQADKAATAKPKPTTEQPAAAAPVKAKHKKHAKKSATPATPATPATSATPAAPASK